MHKRFNYFFTVMIVFSLMITACSEKMSDDNGDKEKDRLENLNDAEMPIVKETITLEIFAGQSPTTNPDWNDVLIFNEYEELTNIDAKFQMVPHESLSEKRNLELSSNDLPDAFHSARVSNLDISKSGDQGIFIPLNDLIDEYAPNFKKILDENPDIRKAITFPDGNIYSFPQLIEPEFYSSRIGPIPWINQEWLDTLGMDIPETTDEFYEYLKAVKNEDPGDNDGIPYGSDDIVYLIEFLYGSFGVANKGTSNPNIDLDPDDSGKVRFYPTTQGYKEALEYIHKLYAEELIEQNIYTIDRHTYFSQGGDKKYGSTNWFSVSQDFGDEAGGQFTNMLPLIGPHGDQVHTRISSPVSQVGAFLITNENKHPEATMRWVDYFYGDEGQKLFYMGIEGETFEEKSDGSLDHVDDIKNHPDGLTFSEAIAEYLTYGGGGYPSIVTEKFYRGGASHPERLTGAEDLVPYLVEDPWPTFIYTKEENAELSSFGSDIDKYVSEMRDKFIVGEVSFEEWDDYVNKLENMGLADYMEIQQNAFERYEDN